MKFNRWAKAVFMVGVLMALILPLQLQAAEDTKAIDDYNFAAWLYNSGKYAMATESYQGFLKNHADHAKAPDARFGLAQSFFHQDNFKDAAEQYEALRVQCPNFAQMPEVLFQLGQARIGLNQFADAQKLFAELRSRFPDHYLADWALAREGACLISMGKPKDAEPLLQTFLGKYTAPDKPSAKVAATGEMLAKLDKAGIKAGDAFLELVERSAFYAGLAQFNQENFAAAQKLTPRSAWRRKYGQWPALRKLRYVDSLMRHMRSRPARCLGGKLENPITEMTMLLAEHYGQRAERYRATAQGYVDDKLRDIFRRTRGHNRSPAHELLGRHHANLLARVAHWSGLGSEDVGTIIAKLEDRTQALGLVFPRATATDRLMDLTALATALAMDVTYMGRFTE